MKTAAILENLPVRLPAGKYIDCVKVGIPGSDGTTHEVFLCKTFPLPSDPPSDGVVPIMPDEFITILTELDACRSGREVSGTEFIPHLTGPGSVGFNGLFLGSLPLELRATAAELIFKCVGGNPYDVVVKINK